MGIAWSDIFHPKKSSSTTREWGNKILMKNPNHICIPWQRFKVQKRTCGTAIGDVEKFKNELVEDETPAVGDQIWMRLMPNLWVKNKLENNSYTY